MSQFEYIMVMVSLILALAVAQALRGLSEVVTSEHLSKVRRSVCALGVVFITLAVVSNVIFFGSPLLHPYRIFQGLVGALYLIGFFSKNETINNAIPYLLISTVVIGQIVVRLNIGALVTD
jgi:hypothetical protein